MVREQYFIDQLQPEYNILKFSGSSLGLAVFSDAYKYKLNYRKKKLPHLVRFNTIYSSQMFYSSSGGSAVYSSYFPAVVYDNADTQKLQILR